MKYRIGVDVGGTFTDLLAIDESGSLKIYKTPSTPQDPSIGTMKGLEEIATAEGSTLKDFLPNVEIIVHGTTITTNAIVTRTYAKTGLLTTKGFRDYLNDRRGDKPHVTYVCKTDPPEPIVPRRLIQVAEEALDCEGKVMTPLKEEDVYAAAELFKKEKVEAVAINFLFSFFDSSHEKRAKEILEKELPGVYVCVSSDILPQVRVYERGSTVVFNACIAPLLRKYIEKLMSKLEDNKFGGSLFLMQSNGGVMSPEVAMDFAVNTLLSGPAGGPQAGLFYAGIHDIKDFITVDMGGTTFDACLTRNAEPEITVENEVAGYRMAMPSLAIHALGAGGGSIAHIDRGGILRVGPRSAGAEPGPVCYGIGGEKPTVTDANLVLGYLNPDYFLGGKMEIKPEKAEKAIMEQIAQPLGLDLMKAASGIYSIINTNMAEGVRMASVARGYDPRLCMLVVAGGAGPIHCCEIAKELGMPVMLVPKSSSVFCASGMLVSNIRLRHDSVKVCYMLTRSINYDLVNAEFEKMREWGRATLEREKIPPERMQFHYSCDMRYEGQFHEIEVPFPIAGDTFTPEDLPALLKAFDQRHDTLYGYNMPGTQGELMCLRLVAEGIVEKVPMKELPYLGEDASSAIKLQRKIYLNGEYITVPVYDGSQLGNGHKILGPAIIEEATTTILITPDYEVACDKFGDYVMYLRGRDMEEILDMFRK